MTARTFSDLGVSEPVVGALAARDIVTPFAIQSLVMQDALAGRDVLAKSRTGSGKTLAFAIPIVERLALADGRRPALAGGHASPNGTGAQRPRALVLVPTRELAAQVVGETQAVARVLDLHVAAAYGGVSIREQAKAVSRADILVATPGRLEDLAERGLVKLGGVGILILDEADRMLDMGFQPQVDRIVRRLTKDRQTMFFSATLDGAVGYLASRYTRDATLHEVASPKATVEEASHRFIPVTANGKLDTLIELLDAEPGRALIFVRTKAGADRLAAKLKSRGRSVVTMHGDISQNVRERALERFESGKVNVLVATDVAARGLDVENIAHVINYDPPAEDTAYVHRVGRTARAGRTGTGVTLVLPEQQGDVSRMAARLKLGEDFEREGMKVAPPRVVFSSRGRRSPMRPRRRTA